MDKKNIRFVKDNKGNRVVDTTVYDDSESNTHTSKAMIIGVAGIGMISQHISNKIIDILNSHTQSISYDRVVVEVGNDKNSIGELLEREKISQNTIGELLIITKIDRDDITDVILQNNISTPRYTKTQKRSGWQNPQKAKGSTKKPFQRKK